MKKSKCCGSRMVAGGIQCENCGSDGELVTTKCWPFIRIMFWIGVATTLYLIVKLVILVATYDFCPLYYGFKCL